MLQLQQFLHHSLCLIPLNLQSLLRGQSGDSDDQNNIHNKTSLGLGPSPSGQHTQSLSIVCIIRIFCSSLSIQPENAKRMSW